MPIEKYPQIQSIGLFYIRYRIFSPFICQLNIAGPKVKFNSTIIALHFGFIAAARRSAAAARQQCRCCDGLAQSNGVERHQISFMLLMF